MSNNDPRRTGARYLIAGAVAATLLVFAPVVSGTCSQAKAEVTVTAEFQTALSPFGRWERSSRWGEVWIPAHVEKAWRPYTVGHWVYTDDWGWYWVSADTEADWGWIVYHYGRWVLDADLGWVWVPGNEWGPAWVTWRRGSEHVGWAPLPPDQIVTEYRDQPDVWMFVRTRDLTAPRVVSVILPPREEDVYIRKTVVVNRTVLVEHGPHLAVNPGIAPTIIAARVGHPLHAYDVRPRVLAGTARIRGAVEVSANELRTKTRERTNISVRRTDNVIQAAKSVPKPEQLSAGEKGRLGDHPPQAARAQAQQQEQRGGREQAGQNAGQKTQERVGNKGRQESTGQRAGSNRRQESTGKGNRENNRQNARENAPQNAREKAGQKSGERANKANKKGREESRGNRAGKNGQRESAGEKAGQRINERAGSKRQQESGNGNRSEPRAQERTTGSGSRALGQSRPQRSRAGAEAPGRGQRGSAVEQRPSSRQTEGRGAPSEGRAGPGRLEQRDSGRAPGAAPGQAAGRAPIESHRPAVQHESRPAMGRGGAATEGRGGPAVEPRARGHAPGGRGAAGPAMERHRGGAAPGGGAEMGGR
ncbi:MAG TPA: DUF6600 domain-containing protein [Pseudolabrys sp.]|nr:DUF6600 domain-containing protein [Pseudolabrys sp.]